jgi:WD40 repeat protein
MSAVAEVRLSKFRPDEQCEVSPGVSIASHAAAAATATATAAWFTGNSIGELIVFSFPTETDNHDLSRKSLAVSDDPLESVAVSHSGDKVAIASDRTLSLRSLADQSEIPGCSARFALPVTHMQFSPDDSYM